MRHIIRHCLVIGGFLAIPLYGSVPDKLNAIIFDSGRHDESIYRTTAEIMHKAGFASVTYMPIDRILSAGSKDLLGGQSLRFFIIDEALIHARPDSPAAQAFLKLLNTSTSNQQALHVLMFPHVSKLGQAQPIGNPLDTVLPILQAARLPVYTPLAPTAEQKMPQTSAPVTISFAHLMRYLFHPFGLTNQQVRTYNTPLHLAQADYHHHELLRLPVTQPTNPLGTFIQEKNLIIGNKAILSFSSIQESCNLYPTNVNIRDGLHATLAAAFRYCANHLKNPGKEIKEPLVKVHLASQAAIQQQVSKKLEEIVLRHDSWHSPIKKTAWMDIDSFATDKDEAHQKKLIDAIYQTHLQGLWLTIAPNQYYSPIGRYRKNQAQLYQTIANFTWHLKQGALQHQQPVPKILVSIELANNLEGAFESHYTCAKDLYGTSYPDIPSPLCQAFWHHELLRPCILFAHDWKKYSRNVPLSGFVIDLELYNRTKSKVGEFTDLMGFEEALHTKFLATTKGSPITTIPANRLPAYFNFLTHQATMLGKQIRQSLSAIIPNPIIGCYAPAICLDWFYKGLFRGLSKRTDPFYLFTFNNAFKPHLDILENNRIFVYHASVLMLSKLTNQQDITLVDKILDEHHGIWFNRFSRIVDPYEPQAWHYLEQSPASPADRSTLLAMIGKR